MRSYKLILIKALPNEMKFLSAYSFKIGVKLIVDEADFVGFMKEGLNVGYPLDPDAVPPKGVAPMVGVLSIPTEDNFESKKLGILGLYQWAQKLDKNLFHKVVMVYDDNTPIQACIEKVQP